MNTMIRALHFLPGPELEDFVRKTLEQLTAGHTVHAAEVLLKPDIASRKQKKVCVISLWVPGLQLRARASAGDFFEAVTAAAACMDRQWKNQALRFNSSR